MVCLCGGAGSSVVGVVLGPRRLKSLMSLSSVSEVMT